MDVTQANRSFWDASWRGRWPVQPHAMPVLRRSVLYSYDTCVQDHTRAPAAPRATLSAPTAHSQVLAATHSAFGHVSYTLDWLRRDVLMSVPSRAAFQRRHGLFCRAVR